MAPHPQQQPSALFQDDQRVQPELEASILRFWDTVRKSADTIVTLRQENARLKADVAAARSEVTTARAETSTVRAEGDALRASLAELETTIADLSATVARLEAERLAMDDERLAAEQERSALERERDTLQQALAEHEAAAAQAAAAQAAATVPREALDELADELEQLKVREQDFLDQLAKAATDYERQRDATAQLQAELSERITEASSLRAELDGVRAELDDALRGVDRLEDSLGAAATSTIAERDEQIALLSAALKGATDQLTDVRDRVDAANDVALDMLKLRTELDVRSAALADLQQQLDEARAAAREAQEANTAGDEAAHHAKAYAETVLALEQELDALQNALAERDAALQAGIGDIERLTAIIERYRSAGLRYIEDPSMDGQMSLFAPLAAPPAAPTIAEPSLRPGITSDELLALAGRLDAVADRVGRLFGIS